MRILLLLIHPLIWVIVSAGALCHATVADSVPACAPLFYATPWPLLLVLTAFEAASWKRNRILGPVFLAATLALAITWYARCYEHPAPAAGKEPGARVFYWNAARGIFGSRLVLDEIQSANADIIGLVEAPRKTPDDWASALKGYQMRSLAGGMFCAVRGRIHTVRFFSPGNGAWCNLLSVSVGSDSFDVALVDIPASLRAPRGQILTKLWSQLKTANQSRLIVMGDFNTPYESTHFLPFREGLHHAFGEAGSGFRATWPVPLPVLALDHVWLGRDPRRSAASSGGPGCPIIARSSRMSPARGRLPANPV